MSDKKIMNYLEMGENTYEIADKAARERLDKLEENPDLGIGATTEEGGIIFNDEENNKAMAQYSQAIGTKTRAGGKGYKITNVEIISPDSGPVQSAKITVEDTDQNIDSKYTQSDDEGDLICFDGEGHWYNQLKITGLTLKGDGTSIISVEALPNANILRDQFKPAVIESGEDANIFNSIENWVWVVGKDDEEKYNAGVEANYSQGAFASGEGAIAMGRSAHSLGRDTKAIGNYSHAEGRNTTAVGYGAHAEGVDTVAGSFYAHAEGYLSQATNQQAHAEGRSTEAHGQASHAEGWYTIATEQGSHVEGKFNVKDTGNKFLHITGNGTSESARSNAFAIDKEGNGYFKGDIFVNCENDSSTNSSKGIAENLDNKVDKITGKGLSTNDYTTVDQKKLAGIQENATAVGKINTKKGEVFNDYINNTASGHYSHAEGYKTTANNSYSHAEGCETAASGSRSHAEGSNTVAGAIYSHAEGYRSEAINQQAHAEGRITVAKGQAAHSEGSQTIAAGFASHAEGSGRIIKTTGFLEVTNFKTQVSGSIGVGVSDEIQSGDSISFKDSNNKEYFISNIFVVEADSGIATIEFYNVMDWEVGTTYGPIDIYIIKQQAQGKCSHTEGEGTIAIGQAEHVQGRYNKRSAIKQGPYSNFAHIVGNGTSNVSDNAYELTWEGNAHFAGTVFPSGADYAEMFEWEDGNLDNEDRIGYAVTLKNDKIAKAQIGEEILGIISETTSILGDNAAINWKNKYLTDDFGRIIYDMVKIENSETEGFIKQPRLNPEYDPQEPYIPREERPEWAKVGLLGKIYARDDGTCQVNDYATIGIGGKLTASSTKTNMRVLSRVNDNVIRVLLK